MRINQIPKEQMLAEGAFIERRMSELKVTQDELADDMQLTQGTISKWCKGIKPVNDKRLMWIAGRLSFDPFELRPSLKDYIVTNYSGDEKLPDLAKKMFRFLSLAEDKDRSKFEPILDAFLDDIDNRQNTQQ